MLGNLLSSPLPRGEQDVDRLRSRSRLSSQPVGAECSDSTSRAGEGGCDVKMGIESLGLTWTHNKVDWVLQHLAHGSYPATKQALIKLYGQPNGRHTHDSNVERCTEWVSKDGKALDALTVTEFRGKELHGTVMITLKRLDPATFAKDYLAPTTETTP